MGITRDVDIWDDDGMIDSSKLPNQVVVPC